MLPEFSSQPVGDVEIPSQAAHVLAEDEHGRIGPSGSTCSH
ncbi:hypothetical protein [Pseudarthrobacter sp. SSS035]|nr:hypothetical protein [Pseudarthrobacter sp. SSS035]